MDPLEQRLREEVIYLHSLWHLGPPPNPNSTTHYPSQPNPRPPSSFPRNPEPLFPQTLRVSNPPSFKPDNRRKRNRMGRINIAASASTPADSGGAEWPISPPIVREESGWGQKKQSTAVRQPTAEEVAGHMAMQMQLRVSDTCREFFRKTAEEEDDIEDDDEEEDGCGEMEGREEYKFLLDIFVKDKELRDYYERNHEDGEFYCVVCGAANRLTKSVKKFKNCQGLLSHALSISKTTKRRAHRAFGMVICKVFGWDVERLPVIVLKGESLIQSLKSRQGCSVENENANTNQDLNKLTKSSVDEGNGENSKVGDGEAHDDSQIKCMDAEDSLKEGEAEDSNTNISHEEKDDSEHLPTTNIEWPCQNAKDDATSEWPSLKPPAEISAEEKEKIDAEQKVIEACRAFFRYKYSLQGYYHMDKDSVMDVDEDEDDSEEEEDEDEECEEFNFFISLFTKDAKLRGYYENNSGDGDFCCLVCSGVGKKCWKRYKGCVVLLNHAKSILGLKIKVHRAYARAVCKVLGWDIEQLPKVVFSLEPLSRTLEKSASLGFGALQVEWPCENVDSEVDSGWPTLEPASDPVSAEEKEKLAAEQKVLEACREFFRHKYGAEYCNDEDENKEEENDLVDEDEDEGDRVDEECEEFKFFMNLFIEDTKLRDFYQNSHRGGDFACLVCGGVRKKVWRRFKGCPVLLDHSNTIWMTQKKAHRAYAMAVCKVLGWDINQLPKIVGISETNPSSASENTAGFRDSAPIRASADGEEEVPVGDEPVCAAAHDLVP